MSTTTECLLTGICICLAAALFRESCLSKLLRRRSGRESRQGEKLKGPWRGESEIASKAEMWEDGAKHTAERRLPLVFSTCETYRLRSAHGLPYVVSISLPLSYESRDPKESSRGGDHCRYPVLYVLDGEPYLFPLLVTAARTEHYFKSRRGAGFPDLIVVGITADIERECAPPQYFSTVGDLWTALRPTRARDYLPTAAESPWGVPGSSSLLDISGHATTFLRDFLASTLVPFVDRTFRTQTESTPTGACRAIVGKSFGGSAVAHLLLDPKCAPLFQHFLMCSPSLSWDDDAFFRLEEEGWLAKQPPLAGAVLICAGGNEVANVKGLMKFQNTLQGRKHPGLKIEMQVLDGEDHGSASYPFVSHALAWLACQLS
ncbi:hypothetical protein CYMTET_4641 [Cymbomonas tetramitiformis]|uniref:Esterase n=1 Tax=Cymbomonas tetramitiformis TaxID=36881 RepID=A0AAE0H101_9CHLO|nr:hypothetical protein CYMTET_4641 [Cymbomonas tetramitiformis]